MSREQVPGSAAQGKSLRAAGVDATYFALESRHGHLASGADAAIWAPALAAFIQKLEAA